MHYLLVSAEAYTFLSHCESGGRSGKGSGDQWWFGNMKTNQPTNIIQQNPTNYMTFQTRQETKHRTPSPKEEVIYSPTLGKQWGQHFERRKENQVQMDSRNSLKEHGGLYLQLAASHPFPQKHLSLSFSHLSSGMIVKKVSCSETKPWERKLEVHREKNKRKGGRNVLSG